MTIIAFPSPMGIFFISICVIVTDKFNINVFPSPMGIFFISISWFVIIRNFCERVSVPYGDLFYFYLELFRVLDSPIHVSVPYGDLFYFYNNSNKDLCFKNAVSFRPLWGSFLFLFLSYGNLTGYRENLHFAV